MDALITRVQALIAKAESSPYPAEADAFMAKAQELISAHAIDQARLRGVDPGAVGHESIPVTGTYSKERAMIWGAVANANRCQMLTLSTRGSAKVNTMTLIGRDRDRQLVRMLATSLELQALKRMRALDTTTSFEAPVVQRRSFLKGFVLEVADRLRRSSRMRTPGTDAVEQALMLSTDAVQRYVADHFDVSQSRRSANRMDGLAFSRGRRAGAHADVGATRLGDRRRSLPPG